MQISNSNPELFIPQDSLAGSKTGFIIEEDNPEEEIPEENGEIRIREEDNGELRIREEHPRPILTIEQRGTPKPGLLDRWGSFFKFLIEGESMDDGARLRKNYKIKDEIKIIENPDNEIFEGERPVLEIQERGNEEVNPSPLHIFHENHHVREKPEHITRKKDDSIKKREDKLPEYGKTVYTLDKVYRHTTIDDITREREFEAWEDKEIKCYTIAGISLAVAVVSLIALPIVTAIVVTVVAAAIFTLMAMRVHVATAQVYKWRDQIPEYYDLRQDIAASHKYNNNGARKLLKYNELKHDDLIGKVFHPKEALKFWEDEHAEYITNFEKRMESVEHAENLDDATLSAFYKHNPYRTYDYIASHFDDIKPEHHDKHEALREKFSHLERAFASIQRDHDELSTELKESENREEQIKNEWLRGIANTFDTMIEKLGPEPVNRESEDYQQWIIGQEKIMKIYEYYRTPILNKFLLREMKFDAWAKDRKEALENSKNTTRDDLCQPILAWWKLAQNLDAEDWDIKTVEISNKIKHDHQIEPLKELPKPSSYQSVFVEPKETELVGIDRELIKQFCELALAGDPQKNEPQTEKIED